MATAFLGADRRGAPPTPATAQKAAGQAAKAEGFAYCAGATKHGAVGLPHAGEPLTAPRLQTRFMNEGVVQVSCGWRHSAYVLSSGEVYTCGEGTDGKLGSGETASSPEPQPVSFGAELFVMHVSCGQHHTAFVGADRTVWTCGLGLYGQLGHGGLASEASPRCVASLRGRVVAAACGDLHTLLLSDEGRPLACGMSEGGRLGLPAPKGQKRLEPCVTTPRDVPLHGVLAAAEAFRVSGVSCGGAHAGLTYSDGSAYTFGHGERGQLGHGSTLNEPLPRKVSELQGTRLKRLSCGAQHTLFLSVTGGVYACGSGGSGRLGLAIGLGGREGCTVPRQVPGLSGTVVVQVSAGAFHSSFVTEDGSVLLCGANENGQLGLNGTTMVATAVTAPPKLWRQRGAVVLGASCGGEHTIFVTKALVDPEDDARADEHEAAAKIVQRLVRGSTTRKEIAAGPRRPKPQLPGKYTEAERIAAAVAIQSVARSRAVRRRRAAEARRAAFGGGPGGAGVWSGLRNRFVAAITAKPIAEAAAQEKSRHATMSKSDW